MHNILRESEDKIIFHTNTRWMVKVRIFALVLSSAYPYTYRWLFKIFKTQIDLPECRFDFFF